MSDPALKRITQRLTSALDRDRLVYETTHDLRNTLKVDRVVLYYFYRHWTGQVTYEALQSKQFSILGSTGPDDCFNGDYASWYEQGRIRAIDDIEIEPITPCHREFLQRLQVRANLVVPVLNNLGLWGLLIAHNCQDTKHWQPADLDVMKAASLALANSPSIANTN
ncbi:GAF domain-containing protein [Crocosphaera sp. UHCC 0190]|uniref:GAF domain-containing protein n=1 Tax=Crocosphaera sp. UHCC 0190 TaxID=3110246 RepID=UPI002B204CE1|nr:GAF domain-containing protein [Crocosphaera sp. UHCC 0190]MEA5511175.1 GAF domain-containing protein [Crocosphaera sp. UHCC 0190]